jgi:hypothetical protein
MEEVTKKITFKSPMLLFAEGSGGITGQGVDDDRDFPGQKHEKD